MTAKTMAEVLAEHSLYGFNGSEVSCGCRSRGPWFTIAEYAAHQAAALSTAGFGLVTDAKAEAPKQQRRRRREPRNFPEAEWPTYPPDPHWGTDDRGRFRYVDYDDESLHIWRDKDGELWIDKKGEGPVYVRSEDEQVIIDALRSAS